ncbi:zinc transport system substrate-binding protein [Methanolinea mesophila]|uniref:metal ABC transporter solute-binding protein, Zn/Mn family n=1 Tax=Methanolinea mesophila TaxID=547055 RepID=UPI003158FF53|nr:zinc transport system substrate-binding protein [Methanolinea mesophila]
MGIAGCVFLLVVCALLAAGCTQPAGVTGAEPLKVAVTLPPQAEMVREVGGDHVTVQIVVPPGADPHTFEPTAGEIVRLSDSTLYFRVGPGLLPFEDVLVDRLREIEPGIRVIDSSEGIALLAGTDPDERGAPDPHIWLSLRNAEIMTAHVRDALIEADPAHADEYRANSDDYISRLHETDGQIRQVLAGSGVHDILVTHPSWGYFTRDYGITQVAIGEEGKEPTARELEYLVNLAETENIRVIFAEPEFSIRGAQVLAEEINGTVVLVDPLSEEYLENMRRVAAAFAGEDTTS